MEKQLLLESIEQCVNACEDLATACSASSLKNMGGDCLDTAIDCADGGMILIMKLSADDNELHRNLIKQFVGYCQACITSCAMYDHNEHAHRALWSCQKSIKACILYIEDHVRTDNYYYMQKPHATYSLAYRWKHLLAR